MFTDWRRIWFVCGFIGIREAFLRSEENRVYLQIRVELAVFTDSSRIGSIYGFEENIGWEEKGFIYGLEENRVCLRLYWHS